VNPTLPTHAELGAPPKLAPDTLRVVALGGLGEIGRNMTVFEINSRLLIVDCGVLFPEESQPGVDLILPDFDYIRNRLEDIDGLVLTHAHEDHVGALPYLLRERLDIPIYGSKLTLGLVSAKLREHRMKPELIEVAAGGSEKIGSFDVEFVAVNHSIPDALAVAINTPAGRVLHTGDFKMDQLPLDGRITDLNSFARLGDEGVDLFLVDSTNAEVPGFVTSEQKIAPVMDEVFAKAPGRLIVGCFASHIHRVQQVINAAVTHNRRVAFVGRSMVRTMNVARDLGYLKIPGGVVVSVDQLDELPDDQVVMVCTGSQGEPMAALARIANRDHKIRVHEQDTVLLASSVIPGNENSINRVINGLSRWGVNVIHTGNALVHVSGHAAAGELLYVYNIVKPANVMPVHGEVRHLIANAELAVAAGVDPEHVLLAEDGTAIDLKDGVAKVVGRVPCGYVFVDGSSVGELSEGLLKDRRILSEEGFVSVFVAVDISNGKIVAGPEVTARGFAEGDKVFDDVVPKIAARVEEAMADGVTDSYQLQQLIRRTTGKWVGERLRRRPMIVPVVIEA